MFDGIMRDVGGFWYRSFGKYWMMFFDIVENIKDLIMEKIGFIEKWDLCYVMFRECDM